MFVRLSLVLGLLLPAALFGAGTRVREHVVMHVPLIAAVEGPAQVVLAPGEVAHIRVSVLANVSWILSIRSPNDCAQCPATLSGQPGGVAANGRDVDICCSSAAPGQQTIALVYTLMPR
jgi:hypothetical protein